MMAEQVVASVIDNKAKDVGLAWVTVLGAATELGQTSMCLHQATEQRSKYSSAASLLRAINPDTLLVSSGRSTSHGMMELLKEVPPHTRIVETSRTAFSDGRRKLLDAVAGGSDHLSERSNYLAVAAAASVLDHCENQLGVRFRAGSVLVRPVLSDEFVQIDAATAESLGLTKTRAGSTGGASLLELMDRTTTRQGSRLLRTFLLAPSCDRSTIAARHDAVQCLREDSSAADLRRAMTGLPDLAAIELPRGDDRANPKRVQTIAMALSTLRKVIRTLPAITSALPELSELLCTIKSALSDQCWPEIDAHLSRTLEDDQVPQGGFLSALNAAYMVRAPPGSQLALTRDTIASLTRQVQDTAAEFAARSVDARLDLRYSAKHGWCFAGWPRGRQVPEGLRVVPGSDRSSSAAKGTVALTCDALMALSARLRDCQHDALQLSQKVLAETLSELIEVSSGMLATLFDNLAYLDVLLAFAEVAREQAWTAPTIADQPHSPLVLRGGRSPFLPADSVVAQAVHFMGGGALIFGSNDVGKTTLLHLIGVSVVLALAGSFVPASMALVPIVDRLVFQGIQADSIETCASTLAAEIASLRRTLDTATARSLVLVDELAAGATGSRDAVALSWAALEALMARGGRVIASTHDRAFLKFARAHADSVEVWSVQEGYIAAPSTNLRSAQYGRDLAMRTGTFTGLLVGNVELAGIINQAAVAIANHQGESGEEAIRPDFLSEQNLVACTLLDLEEIKDAGPART